MKIEGHELQDSDVDRYVTYVPLHAEGDTGHPDCERGRIRSWNSLYVFVEYGNRGSIATCADDLVWG